MGGFVLMLLVVLSAFVPEVHAFMYGADPHVTVAAGAVALASLANTSGSSEGEANPGGTRRLLVIMARDFTTIWPSGGDITDGEITNGVSLKDGAAFAQYDFPEDSFGITDTQDGDPGYQSYKHMANFNMAGFSKKITGELRKHFNAGCVIVAVMNDGTMAVCGASDNPIYMKSAFSSGQKGSDKRGFTLKGEQDGFMWGILPLKPDVAVGLPLLPIV